MVQSAQPRKRNHRRVCLRLALDRSALRRVLSQRVVNPVLVVIAHIVPKQTQKMTLVQSNNMIQELTAAASYPTFGSSILPGRSHARSFRCQACRLQERRHGIVELRISIQDHITIGAGFRKRGTQLLDNPIRRWVPRDIEVQDLTPGVLDHEEAVQQLKGDRRNREEVEGDNRFSVILQKRQPLFPRIAPTSDAPQIAGDRAFGNDKAEFLQLTMDLGWSR